MALQCSWYLHTTIMLNKFRPTLQKLDKTFWYAVLESIIGAHLDILTKCVAKFQIKQGYSRRDVRKFAKAMKRNQQI